MSQLSTKFIKDSAVTAAKLATDAVTTAKIADANVTSAKLQSSINLAGTPTAATAATATSTTQLATTAFVHNVFSSAIQGIDVKESVRAASAGGSYTLTPEAGTITMDGVSLVDGDRVLLKDQSTASENGIYVYAYFEGMSSFSRSNDADSSAEVTAGMFCFVEEGTANADSGWVLSTDGAITLDTTALTFAQFSGAGSISAGDGLTKTGNVLSVNVDASTIEINADTLRVKDAGITSAKIAASAISNSHVDAAAAIAYSKLALSNSIVAGDLTSSSVTTAKIADDAVDKSKIAADVAGSGLSQAVGGELDVNVDGSTLEINTDALRVKDAGITAAKLASDSVTTIKILDANVTAAKLASDSVTTIKILDSNVTTAKLADDSVTAAKLAADTAGAGLSQAVGGELDVNVDGSTLEINTDALRVKDAGITAAKLASDSVTTIKILDANVTAAKLASDSVTTAKILDANVTAAKLASDSVTTAKITDANVTNAKLATDAVTGAKIKMSRYELTLDSTDVGTNFYKDITATHFLKPESAQLFVDGVMQRYGVDYDFLNTGSQTRIRFGVAELPASDLCASGAAALVAGDKLYVQGVRND